MPCLAACALHRARLAGRPDFFGAGGCLLVWHGVGGFATNRLELLLRRNQLQATRGRTRSIVPDCACR